MDNSIKREKGIYINYLLVLLIFISFYNMSNNVFRCLGLLSIGIVFFISILQLLRGTTRFGIKRLMTKPIIYSQFIICSYIITFFLDFSIYNLRTIIQFILLWLYLLSLVNIDFSKTRYRKLSFVFFIILLMCYIPIILGYGQTPIGYKAVFSTTTFLGIFSLLLMELSFLAYKGSGNKVFILHSILFLILITLAQTRAALLGASIIICTYAVLSAKKIRAFTWKLTKNGLIGMIISLVVIYPNLDKFSWYPELSQFVYNVTGKILMSGRNIIWADAVDLIKESPLFGHGFGAFSNFNISPHNSYLGIGIQSGLFGLTSIALFINSLFNIMYKYRQEQIVKTCTCFFVGNLVVCSFEVMLFQGQLVLSLLLWLIVAIGVSKALRMQGGQKNWSIKKY